MAALRGHQACGTRRMNGHYQNGDGERLMWDFDVTNAIRGTSDIPEEIRSLQRYNNSDWKPPRINVNKTASASLFDRGQWWKVELTLDYNANFLLTEGYISSSQYMPSQIVGMHTMVPSEILIYTPYVAIPIVRTNLTGYSIGWSERYNMFYTNVWMFLDKSIGYHPVQWTQYGQHEAFATDGRKVIYYLIVKTIP